MPEGGETQSVCADFDKSFEAAREEGWVVEAIWPADAPHSAILSRDGERMALTSRPGAVRPDGRVPPIRTAFHVANPAGQTGLGRAGMRYRDLIPSRLGGYVAASHIFIPQGGPVADWAHFHRLALQVIAIRRGWVRVVYQGQGPAFLMKPGDLVLQPPTIRHRVLESSPGLEVVEISIPAEHETFADHDIALPGEDMTGDVDIGGQSFLFHRGSDATWEPFNGGEAQLVGLWQATGGKGEAHFVRPVGARAIDMPASNGELGFGFILEGEAALHCNGTHDLAVAAAFSIPPEQGWQLRPKSEDLRLLWVTTNALSGQSA